MKNVRIILFAAILPLLAACNTIEGMGEDIQNGGQKIENAAEKHK